MNYLNDSQPCIPLYIHSHYNSITTLVIPIKTPANPSPPPAPGTNGGVSLWGTIASGAGGLLTGVGYFCCAYFTSTQRQWRDAPSQLDLVWVATVAGVIGSVVDSLLGATVQYSGWSVVCLHAYAFVVLGIMMFCGVCFATISFV